MISVTEALGTIRKLAHPLPDEPVPLEQVSGRILRESVAAPEDMPPFDRSAMDGYAIRDDEKADDLEVVAEIRAGQTLDHQLAPGHAIRIFTGARLPPGPGLRVVMQEDTQVAGEGKRVRLLRRSSEHFIRRRGEDARAGEVLLQPGLRLHPAGVSLLAALGKTTVRVTRSPKILHLTTGDEIVPPGQPLRPGEIRNSNAYLIGALCRERGAGVTHLHAPDRLEEMTALLAGADPSRFDLILLSGGSGGGAYDFTAALFEFLKAKIEFRQVAVRPGKPLIFGRSEKQLVFGLPGNAVSHLVCFHLFVRAALTGLLGLADVSSGTAALAEPARENPRETWWPVASTLRDGRLHATPLGWKNSGDITRLASADGLIRIPSGSAQLPAGHLVEYLPLRGDL